MTRTHYYPTISGATVRHLCATPGPKPLPVALRKRNITVRLRGTDVAHIDQAAIAAGLSRQAWIENAIVDRLRMA